MGLFDDIQDWWNGLSDRWNAPHDDPWDAVLDVMDIDDANRKKALSLLSSVPVIGDVLKASDQYKQTQDYLDNRGLDWKDLEYPALTNIGQNSLTNGIRSGYSFVSKNIEKLYSDSHDLCRY